MDKLRLKNCKIIWTVYFDSRLTRSEGRRLPKNLCVPKPTLEELEEACKRLGLKIITSERARYPRIWWLESGYVAVEKSSKRGLLQEISRELRRMRSGVKIEKSG